MSFLFTIFLWAAGFLIIPILIAFWNRQKHRREPFGGYYLLKKVLQTSKRRIQLLEIIKLINRLILITLLILAFAEPVQKLLKISLAEDGFALILDASRVMQLGNLAADQQKELRALLNQMPAEAQGMLLTASDHCNPVKLPDGAQTGSASDWLKQLDRIQIPYMNAELSSAGLSSCVSRIEAVFSGRRIFKAFVSPLPASFDLSLLSELDIRKLNLPPLPEDNKLDLFQEAKLQKLQLRVSSDGPVLAALIDAQGRVEDIGRVSDELELVPTQESWIWLRPEQQKADPWMDQEIQSLRSFRVEQITLWSQKETEGFLSLYSALRTHPHLQVVRQIGGEPVGDRILVYGDFPYQELSAQSYWFFLSPNSQSPFQVRDTKQWSSRELSSDAKKAFQIQTDEGAVFIKQYSLLQLDPFQVLETFEDGAPSLLEFQASSGRVWVTPFDLEDLTTDFTLEPTFIPYLFKRFERWIGRDDRISEDSAVELVWAPPSKIQPSSQALQLRKWPGIYKVGEHFSLVKPLPLPREFHSVPSDQVKSSAEEHEVSRRPTIFKWAAASMLLELSLCLLSLRFLPIVLLLFAFSSVDLEAAEGIQRIPVGYMTGMDGNRLEALEQNLSDIGFLSNLEFSKPVLLSPRDFWKASAVVLASTSPWKGFTPEERVIVRDYLERGGILIFDDPLAVLNSSFYASVVKELKQMLPGRNLKPLSKDDVVYRSFYLLNEVSGRRLASPHIEGVELDGRWIVLFSANDLLGANLRSANGDFVYSVSPYGVMQRILSKRLFLNFLMYAVTLDYKDDAIHLPHILRRRVR